jgi:hypothetical protein
MSDTIIADSSLLVKKRGRKPEWIRRKQGRGRGVVQGNNNFYPDEVKEQVVATFALIGNCRRVSELTDVNESTIRRWKTEPWWAEMMAKVRVEADEELDGKFNTIIEKAMININDRLENGDYVYNIKTGEVVRKGVSAKESAQVAVMMLDKRQLLRGQPTSRSEKVSVGDRLDSLAKEFKKFASSRTIEAEVIREDDAGRSDD